MAKTCPVCQQPLVEMERWGVRLDLCQRCQGVWLDQGELEQIVGYVRASVASGYPPPNPDPRRPYPRDHYEHDDDHDHERGEYDEHDAYNERKRRRGGFEIGDLFDIFG